MTTDLTRREAVLLGTTGLTVVLAGCVGGGSDGGSGDGAGDDGDADDGTTGGGGAADGGTGGQNLDDSSQSVATAVVGEATALGPIEFAVTSVERLDAAPLLGTIELPAGEGNEYLAVEVAFTNASDRYLALAVDLFAAAVGDQTYATAEPFVDIASPAFGGLAFAPGELRRERFHYEIPEGATDARLRLVLQSRSLPDAAFERLTPLQVDLESTTAAPVTPTQGFAVPFQTLGETVAHDGIELTIRDAVVPVEVPGRAPTEDTEFLALDLAVRNGGNLPNPIVIGIGGFGGLTLHDGDGYSFGSAVRFNGEVAGGRRFDPSNGIAPGESETGIAVTEIPVGGAPLYLAWSPPAAYWQADRGVETHRYVWQLR